MLSVPEYCAQPYFWDFIGASSHNRFAGGLTDKQSEQSNLKLLPSLSRSRKIDNPLTYLIYFNLITLKDLFAPLTSCFSTNQKSKLLLPLAPSLMLLLQYGTLYLLTYVTLHLFIHSPLTSKPTFSHPSSFAHSY